MVYWDWLDERKTRKIPAFRWEGEVRESDEEGRRDAGVLLGGSGCGHPHRRDRRDKRDPSHRPTGLNAGIRHDRRDRIRGGLSDHRQLL